MVFLRKYGVAANKTGELRGFIELPRGWGYILCKNKENRHVPQYIDQATQDLGCVCALTNPGAMPSFSVK